MFRIPRDRSSRRKYPQIQTLALHRRRQLQAPSVLNRVEQHIHHHNIHEHLLIECHPAIPATNSALMLSTWHQRRWRHVGSIKATTNRRFASGVAWDLVIRSSVVHMWVANNTNAAQRCCCLLVPIFMYPVVPYPYPYISCVVKALSKNSRIHSEYKYNKNITAMAAAPSGGWWDRVGRGARAFALDATLSHYVQVLCMNDESNSKMKKCT